MEVNGEHYCCSVLLFFGMIGCFHCIKWFSVVYNINCSSILEKIDTNNSCVVSKNTGPCLITIFFFYYYRCSFCLWTPFHTWLLHFMGVVVSHHRQRYASIIHHPLPHTSQSHWQISASLASWSAFKMHGAKRVENVKTLILNSGLCIWFWSVDYTLPSLIPVFPNSIQCHSLVTIHKVINFMNFFGGDYFLASTDESDS